MSECPMRPRTVEGWCVTTGCVACYNVVPVTIHFEHGAWTDSDDSSICAECGELLHVEAGRPYEQDPPDDGHGPYGERHE